MKIYTKDIESIHIIDNLYKAYRAEKSYKKKHLQSIRNIKEVI